MMMRVFVDTFEPEISCLPLSVPKQFCWRCYASSVAAEDVSSRSRLPPFQCPVGSAHPVSRKHNHRRKVLRSEYHADRLRLRAE